MKQLLFLHPFPSVNLIDTAAHAVPCCYPFLCLHLSVDRRTLALFPSLSVYFHSPVDRKTLALVLFPALSVYFHSHVDRETPALALFHSLSVYIHSSVGRQTLTLFPSLCLPSLVCRQKDSRPLSIVCWSKALSTYFPLCLPPLVRLLIEGRSPSFTLCLSTLARLLIERLSPCFPLCLSTFTRLLIEARLLIERLSPCFPLCLSTFTRLLIERCSPCFTLCLSTFTRLLIDILSPSFSRLLIGRLSPYFPLCLSTFTRLLIEGRSPCFHLCLSTFTRLLIEGRSPCFTLCLSTLARLLIGPISPSVSQPSLVCWSKDSRPLCLSTSIRPLIENTLALFPRPVSFTRLLIERLSPCFPLCLSIFICLLIERLSPFSRLLIESTLALFPSLSVYLHSSIDRKTLTFFLSPVDRKTLALFPSLSTFTRLLIGRLSPYFPLCLCLHPSVDRKTLALFPSLSVYFHSYVQPDKCQSPYLLSLVSWTENCHIPFLSVFTCLMNQETIAPLLSSALACWTKRLLLSIASSLLSVKAEYCPRFALSPPSVEVTPYPSIGVCLSRQTRTVAPSVSLHLIVES